MFSDKIWYNDFNMSADKDTRHQILEACLRILVRRGYGAATLAEIARESGLSRQLVLYHLKSPEEALMALAKQWGQTGQQVTLERLAATHEAGEGRVLAMAAAMFEWMRRYPEISKLTPVLFQGASEIEDLKKLQVATLSTGRNRIIEILSKTNPYAKWESSKLSEIASGLHSVMIGTALYIIGLDQYEQIPYFEKICLDTISSIFAKHHRG